MVYIKKKNVLLRSADNPGTEKRAAVKQERSYKVFFGISKFFHAHGLYRYFLVKTSLIAQIIGVALFLDDTQKCRMGRNGFPDSTGELAQVHIVRKYGLISKVVHDCSWSR